MVPAGAVAATALALASARGLGHPLHADVAIRMEYSGLSARRMGVQSLCLATAVRVRRLVRARRRTTACALAQFPGGIRTCGRLCAVCVRHRDDLVLSAACAVCAEIRRRGDLSDRQDQPRRAAHPAFHVSYTHLTLPTN